MSDDLVEKELLYCWVSGGLDVLVPKRRGQGFLRVPYGHHHNPILTDIANSAGCDVYGLDGALEFASFDMGKAAGNLDRAAMKAFEETIIPQLEKHYGMSSRKVEISEFWGNHPLQGGMGR